MAQERPAIRLTDQDVTRARAFAEAAAPTTFNRRGVSPQQQQRDVYIGKLGEIAMARLLLAEGKALRGAGDMFRVWDDIYQVDRMDFQTTDGSTVDVKTASESYHKRILVPWDQYLNQPKHYYVGVRIHQDRSRTTIKGFATHGQLAPTGVGQYPNYGILLSQLQPISRLLELMDDA